MIEALRMRFGDFAEQITERVDPTTTDLDIYVGLEHLDPESLRIRRHGSPADVIGEKLRVRKGDIIFGKRRVYQRKVAIADFEGICSAHAMVLRPKNDRMLSEFFPFFMQSDLFMDRALQISVGSLSPTINWTTLSRQEFMIPTIETQYQTSTMLRAAEDCIINSERLVAVAERAKQVLMRELFSKGIGHKGFQDIKGFGEIPKSWEITTMKKIVSPNQGSIKTGPFGSSLKKEDMVDSGIKVYGQENIIHQNLLLGDRYINQKKFETLKNFELMSGDLVFTRMGTLGKCLIFPSTFEKGIMDFHLLRIRPDPKLSDTRFLMHALEGSEVLLRQVHKFSQGGIMNGFSSSIMAKLQLPLPPLAEQQQITDILTLCDEMIAAARANVASTKALKMRLINELLNPSGRVGS